MNKYDSLKIENQLCFPLYVSAKELTRRYQPILDTLDLTYTQYITMLILWEKDNITSKELGDRLYLDSGTLTPLLTKLEKKGHIIKKKSDIDERNLIVSLSDYGKELKDDALIVPKEISKCINLDEDESITLYKLLYKVLEGIEGSK